MMFRFTYAYDQKITNKSYIIEKIEKCSLCNKSDQVYLSDWYYYIMQHPNV